MKLRKLLEFAASLAEGNKADEEITAVLIYRDEHNGVTKRTIADIGYCSGLEAEIRIEMSTEREEQ